MESCFDIKVETGFFKTTLYNIDVKKGVINLTSKEKNSENIIIKEEDLILISLIKKHGLVLELETKEGKIRGVVQNNENSQNVFNLIKENINKNIIYEEEKGNV